MRCDVASCPLSPIPFPPFPGERGVRGLFSSLPPEIGDRANRKKHGVSFEEARELFTSGVEYLELFDDAHSDDEERFLAIGPIRRGLVLIVWIERDELETRIISARWATPHEARLFANHMEPRS